VGLAVVTDATVAEDEDGAAGTAVTDATVAEGDGDVGMKDGSTRKNGDEFHSWSHPRPSASRRKEKNAKMLPSQSSL